MQHDVEEIDVVAVLVVESVVEVRSAKARGLVDVGIELDVDVVEVRREILVREFVREGDRIPDVRDGNAGGVVPPIHRRRLSEHSLGVRAAGDRREAGAHADIDVRVEIVLPRLPCGEEDVEALLADSRAGVAADRSRRRRVIEAGAGDVVVDDHHLAGAGEERHPAEDDQKGNEKSPAHHYFSAFPRPALSIGASRNFLAASALSTHAITGLPSGAMRTRSTSTPSSCGSPAAFVAANSGATSMCNCTCAPTGFNISRVHASSLAPAKAAGATNEASATAYRKGRVQ